MDKETIMLNEALRYIGVPKEKADLALKEKIRSGFKKIGKLRPPKVIYQKLPIMKKEDAVIIGTLSCQTKSKDLIKLFKNSESCILMAATLGYDIDQEINRLQKIDMLEAIVIDACASVLIDKVCDEAEDEIMKQLDENQYLTMRFSPGYGDVPLDLNRPILQLLMAQKRIGLTLTKTDMLLPIKSITALIGLSSQKENRMKSCGQCNLIHTCLYRKRGEKCGL